MASTPVANGSPPPAPLLRTLAPALRNLERGLRAWLESRHPHPLKPLTRATLEGLVADLRRKILRYIRRHNDAAKPFHWSYADATRRIA